MTSPKIGLLMVTCNNHHLSKKALRSVATQINVDLCKLVVDNCSTDTTKEWLKSVNLDNFAYHVFESRVSLAEAWNFGLSTLFYSCNCTHVLVINNDVELPVDIAYTLFKQDRPFVSGVSVNDYPDLSFLQSPDPHKNYDEKLPTRPHPDFSCFMIESDVFSTVGEFDARFTPAYYEDNDYHIRLAKAGYEAVCVDAKFLHHGAQTIKMSEEKERNYIARCADKNKQYFLSKYGTLPGTKLYEQLCNPEHYTNQSSLKQIQEAFEKGDIEFFTIDSFLDDCEKGLNPLG